MPRRVKSKKLTDEQWSRVYQLRCRAKQGQHLAPDDLAFLEVAFKEDGTRYGAMDVDVFNATVPFGSAVRRKR